MTAPLLSLAQIRNRLALAARTVLRRHAPGRDGRCPVCRVPCCPAARTAEDLLAAIRRGPTAPRAAGSFEVLND
ncbi:hypothetical protein [Micromonospora sp. DT233]|uniref:hypothetical protein n=1 Tax=Micromonospora sp. DT233 TaxID=3393432 RepID=UPI003CEBA305